MATYPIRKLEAALLKEFSNEEVVVAHEDHIEDFIDDKTEIVGVTTMDPFGLAPLTMSYSIFLKTNSPAYVKREFDELIGRINRARAGKKAKLVVGGPGVWEFTVLPEEMEKLAIDHAFQGEADDILCDLFRYILDGGTTNNQFHDGFQTFDSDFHKQWVDDERFITRYRFSRQFPALEDIPDIVNPSVKGLVEVMRGCGIGCDFCEVTLRPLRYYPPERVRREIEVNTRAGGDHAWLHSDEIFAYEHGRNFEPNVEALQDLLTTVMTTKGVVHTNPTHGRISIPAAYPDMLRKLSAIMRAGPMNWIGLQVGVETGSDRLAKMHMPNKTLPLKIGPDGAWADIVLEGTRVMNRYYWRPAFTVQVGQSGETPEDNWETVALINRMSDAEVDGRPLEFTITPMQNVPLGLIKSREFAALELDTSQLAVYYAGYRHLAKVAARNSVNPKNGVGISRVSALVTGTLLGVGGRAMLHLVESVCKKGGLDVEKAARYGVEPQSPQTTLVRA